MMHLKLFKKILKNKLTILALPNKQIPKVSTQLWYNVGSKDEQTGERGIAHLIEHMIFKGTHKLSESDINLMTHKLSGYCNAFTSYDYTGYLFDFPSQHWQEALPIMADCMQNCSFKEDLLNSELKAVIQELKMYNDDYDSALLERMIGAIFADYPYHYPVIGFKQDLWNLKRDALLAFYKRHYVPNNATLVVVGDIEPEDVFQKAEEHFGHLLADENYKKDEFYHKLDIESTAITLYRDVRRPSLFLGWVIPGSREKGDYVYDALSWILASGKGSRLYRLLVDELELATDVEGLVYDFFEHGIFFIRVELATAAIIEKIISVIHEQINNLAEYGPAKEEIERAVRKIEMDFVSLGENNQKLAYLVGKYFLATGDENYVLNYCAYPRENLPQDIQRVMHMYMRPHLMHQGCVLPLTDEDKNYWLMLQQRSDAEDARILDRIVRTGMVEDGCTVHALKILEPKIFLYPRAQVLTLSNGLKIFYHHNPRLPKIDVVLDFKARHWYDPEGREGLLAFVAHLLQEGTTKYSAQELALELESLGISFSTHPGQINMSMLSKDIERGLLLLAHILTESIFNEDAIKRVRTQMLVDIANFWDNPAQFAGQLAKEAIYGQHPYHKNMHGTKESISTIARDELLAAYHAFISPNGARLAIVGNLDGIDIHRLCENIFGNWQGPEVETIVYPKLQQAAAHEINFPINRDQVVLCYAGLSVDRLHPDYDKLLIFDQIFTGGLLGSMSSRLFKLREQSGLFYTIAGSLVARADKQPGMIIIKTIVSPDRLAESEKAIEEMIDRTVDTINADEFDEAKRAIINSFVDHFAANHDMAITFLSLDYLGFPADYFDKRPAQLLNISIDEVRQAVKRWLSSNLLVKIRVGRV